MQAIVVANGEIHGREPVLREVTPGALIVCVDGGTTNALALGLVPHVIIGDMDSVTVPQRRELEAAGTKFIVHSTHKDESDTELALRYCVEQGANEILLLGALGGRLDHMLANLLLLADPTWQGIPLRIVDGDTRIELCTARCEIAGAAGDIVSLLPWGGDALGVHTEGLEYPLVDEPLYFGPARGLSNVMRGERAAVTVRAGRLLVIHHGQRRRREAVTQD